MNFFFPFFWHPHPHSQYSERAHTHTRTNEKATRRYDDKLRNTIILLYAACEHWHCWQSFLKMLSHWFNIHHSPYTAIQHSSTLLILIKMKSIFHQELEQILFCESLSEQSEVNETVVGECGVRSAENTDHIQFKVRANNEFSRLRTQSNSW